jgi:hypothetical protein
MLAVSWLGKHILENVQEEKVMKSRVETRSKGPAKIGTWYLSRRSNVGSWEGKKMISVLGDLHGVSGSYETQCLTSPHLARREKAHAGVQGS